jgi:pilus assembly protein Flp/PilA
VQAFGPSPLSGIPEAPIMLRKFLRDERGATAIEYCLIAVGISAAALATINAMGIRLNVIFSNIVAALP